MKPKLLFFAFILVLLGRVSLAGATISIIQISYVAGSGAGSGVVADAGPDRTLLNTQGGLSGNVGSATTESGATITNNTWTYVGCTPSCSKPGMVISGQSSSSSPLSGTFVNMDGADVGTHFTFRYSATDSVGRTGSDTMDIIIVPALPDLTADPVTQSAATAGTALDLTATIKNIGDYETGIGFFYFFQVANASNGGGTITDLAAQSTPNSLAVNGSLSVKQSQYKFNTVGTYSVRVCADMRNSSSSPGDIDPEKSEDNNCGGWKDIAVQPGVGPVSVTLTASPQTIRTWQSATLTWVSANADSCSGTNFNTGGAVSNSSGVTVTPTATTTYTITCTNALGSVNDSKTVTVVPYKCSNGGDDDGDGKIDTLDPGCHVDGNASNGASYDKYDDDETDVATTQCSNNWDDDGDGKADFGGATIGGVAYPPDPGCKSAADDNEKDPVKIFFWEQ